MGRPESKIDQRESSPRPRALESSSPRDVFRDRIAELVQEQERRAGSRMLAYRAVGRLLRVSDTWVRRLLYGQSVRIELETVTAADTAYAAHCARREARAAALLEAAARRNGESNALLASLRSPGASVDRGLPEPGSARDSAVDRPLPRQGGRP